MIKIGTDCSGIEAPIHAMNNICKKYKKKYKHVFSSDIDKYVLDLHKINYNPSVNFTDITTRDIKKVPNVDVYIAGFPCQPYSRANKYKSLNDKRKNIFYNCYEVIKHKKPKIFLLENVRTLCSDNKGETFKNILSDLKDLKIYNIYYNILNTKDYSVPQSRERLYIIGILKSCEKKPFEWPKKQKLQPLSKFIDKKKYSKEPIKDSNKELFKRVPKDAVYIDVGFRKANYPNSNRWTPCITTQATMWNFKKQRMATVNEYLMLQGFPINFFKQNISDHRFKRLIGNSMSVNVIELLLTNCFLSILYINVKE